LHAEQLDAARRFEVAVERLGQLRAVQLEAVFVVIRAVVPPVDLEGTGSL
jgi:hypothetical protein